MFENHTDMNLEKTCLETSIIEVEKYLEPRGHSCLLASWRVFDFPAIHYNVTNTSALKLFFWIFIKSLSIFNLGIKGIQINTKGYIL